MILIALGANLPSRFGSPAETLAAALSELESRHIVVERRSGLWRTAPVPVSDQPWYYNQVIAVATELAPLQLLHTLHDIEEAFGRTRNVRNEARIIDLDLIAYNEVVSSSSKGITIPHPRMHERLFVLEPLQEIAPDWSHPVTGLAVEELLYKLNQSQKKQ